jgi:antitoxin ParD1/3/4
MTARTIRLTEPQDQFVDDLVRSGAFPSADEVVRSGLDLLKARADRRARKLERLKAAIQVGLDEIERGEGETVEWDQLDDWLDGLGRSKRS